MDEEEIKYRAIVLKAGTQNEEALKSAEKLLIDTNWKNCSKSTVQVYKGIILAFMVNFFQNSNPKIRIAAAEAISRVVKKDRLVPFENIHFFLISDEE